MTTTNDSSASGLTHNEAEILFSHARLAGFSANDDLDAALSICTWEINLRAALIRPINITEIFLRNALDKAIRSWWNENHIPGDWLDDRQTAAIQPLTPLCNTSKWHRQTSRALARVKQQDTITRDDVLSHIMLGTWRNIIGNPRAIVHTRPQEHTQYASWKSQLTMDAACARLWKAATHNAFPNIPTTKKLRDKLSPRAYIGSRVTRMATLRNRICHWDNLLRVDIASRYQDMQDIVAAISTPGLHWMQDQTVCAMQQAINSRPTSLISSIRHSTYANMP